MGKILDFLFKSSQAHTDHDFSSISASEAYNAGLMGAAARQATRGDAHAAEKLGLIFLMSDEFHSADFWLDRASRMGLPSALRRRAELHLMFCSRPVEPNFMARGMPSLDIALSLADQAIRSGVEKSLTLKARILQARSDPAALSDNAEFLAACFAAAAEEKDDWARMIMMIGSMSGNVICLQGKDKHAAVMGWLEHGERGQLTSTYAAKLFMGKFLEGDYMELLRFSASEGNSDGLYLLGKHQMIIEKNCDEGETMVRRSIRKGNVEAMAFLADYKASHPDMASQMEADILYRDASERGHLGARAIMAIRGLQDQARGMSKDRCLEILKDCFLKNVPAARLFAQRHKLFLPA
ncbi:hypothetical protein AA14337_3067 [Acetobacter malorum DSM 14337]|uniref:Sel1 repeat family protein n=1 Tax=Acetobacter malorum DSM 14337 TaxID=1307910 RepID=A0ABQ0PZF6_9PROT|nr:hypothetical protein [Acetobacter malorum]GBQ85420.1 hypothetical protein AA14337_3067 [Acetobacter malorum DSM 14337]